MSYSTLKTILRSPGAWTVFLALAALLTVGAAPAAADHDDYPGDDGYGSYGSGDTAGYESSYSYVRSLEGSATLIQGDTQDRDGLQINQPVLVGDRVWVAPTGRVEIVLADRNLLRIDGGSEVVFEALAASPDREDPATVLRIAQGNVQLVVEPDFLGDDYPRVDTPNATVYANDLGSYRITADEGWTEVLARAGSAEVVTREGSVIVRSGEEAVVEGRDRPRTQVRRASREDSLELWGERLDREGRYASQYVDESIAYEAAHLDRYGSWSRVDGRYGWQPRVADDWRPYWNGRWSFTPLGMTWVSYEPWGWAPYHYGTWDFVPGYGWTWFPGHRFAPAWVYWYWTDHYAGWVPVGYYSRYYWSSYGRYGLRAGVYGYAGGRWDHYGYWNFCETRYFGDRYQYRHVDRGDRFGERHRYAVPKRGIVTTDTRGITRTAVLRSEGIERILSERAARRGGLADVTPFVERRKELPDDVRGRVLVDRGEPSRGDADVRRPTRLVTTDGVPGAGARPSRGDAASAVRSPRRVVERPDDGPERSGVERTAPVLSSKPGVVPSRSERTDRPTRAVPANRAPAQRPSAERPSVDRPSVDRPSRVERPEPTRVTPSKDWRERSATPRREPPARVERREPPSASSERSAPSEVRRSPAVRESESDRSSITRRVVEGVRSNERRSTPSRAEAPSRTERRASPPPSARSSSPSRESYRPSSRESYRPSRSESTSRSSRSSRPSRSTRSSSPPPRTRSSARPSTSTRSRSSAPSRSSSRASSARPSRSSSRARPTRSAPSRSRAKARKPPTL